MKPGQILDIAVDKTLRTLKNCGAGFPHYTENGKWLYTKNGYWTGGFWAGILWTLYQLTEDKKYFEKASFYTRLLEKRKFDRSTQDLGFLFFPSFVTAYSITGETHYKRAALQAADTLLTRLYAGKNTAFIKTGEYFKELPVLSADAMANLPLLLWAYRETKNKKYLQAVESHGKATGRALIRKDGSTAHCALWKPRSRQFAVTDTQGLSLHSCWSRGQAWMIYGFTKVHQYTGIRKTKNIANRLTGYFVKNLPKHGVPPWDFHDPSGPRDSSALAIVLSALSYPEKQSSVASYQLSDNSKFKTQNSKLLKPPALLASLIKRCLNTNPRQDGLLSSACFYKTRNLGVNCACIWGDYFFMEALQSLRSIGNWKF